MSEYTYPGSDLDQPKKLLAMIGSYWSDSYQGNDLLQSTTFAAAQLAAQAHLDFLELIASISRFDLPVFHKENWYFLTFKESEVNNFEALLAEYSSKSPPDVYRAGGLRYGQIPTQNTYSVPVSTDLIDAKVIMNRITEPSLTLTKDVDYYMPKPGVLAFRSNPFDNSLVAVREIWEGGQVVDREGSLWIFRGDWDWDTIYEQFGYALKIRMQSGEGYKALVNAILDALVEGTKNRDYQFAWSAITGIPLTMEAQETVVVIRTDIRSEVVITDQHAYKFPLGSNVIVAVGDVIQAGDPLVDTLQFFEFNRGITPSELTGLAMGPGLLATGFWGDLTFENKTVPLIVEEEVDGYTKVSFELGGFPNDAAKFWDDVHKRGVAAGQTLANLLDVRDNPTTEPGPASLPATINPLQFLCSNVLRYHAFVVRVRTSLMSKKRLGIHAAVNLKKIVPPHTVMIVLVELEYADKPVIMGQPGTETDPGYEENVSGFPMMVASDMLPASLVMERVKVSQIIGKCE